MLGSEAEAEEVLQEVYLTVWNKAGRFDEGTAFATFDGHQTGDMKTYVYKTVDSGQPGRPPADAVSHD